MDKENHHPLLDVGEIIVTKNKEKRLRYLIFASVFTVRPVVWVPSPCAGRQAQGSERWPHNPGGNGEWPATSLSHTQVYGARGDLPKSTEGAGRSAHKAPFHHLPAALANRRGPIWLKVSKCDTHLQEGFGRRI